jgi:hypothetical protein
VLYFEKTPRLRFFPRKADRMAGSMETMSNTLNNLDLEQMSLKRKRFKKMMYMAGYIKQRFHLVFAK